jgi:hypothetical protein
VRLCGNFRFGPGVGIQRVQVVILRRRIDYGATHDGEDHIGCVVV